MSYGWLLALAAAVAWGCSDFLAGRATARSSVWPVLFISMTTAMALAGAVSGMPSTTDSLGQFPAALLGWSVLAGVAEIGGYAGLYRALAGGPLGIASSLAGMGVLVPVAVGLVAGTALSGSQTVGLAVAIGGVALLGWTGGGFLDRRCLLSAAGSAACFGISTLALARGALISPWSAVALMRTTSVVALLPIGMVLWWRRARRSAVALVLISGDATAAASVLTTAAQRARTSVFAVSVVVGILDVAGTFAFAASTTRTSLPIAALASATYPLVTALLARALLTERLPGRLRFGGVAVVVGSALLAM